MADFDHRDCATADEEITAEFEWQGFRLVVTHRPDTAAAQRKKRDEKIAVLEADAAKWAGKLDGQETGQTYRGPKLSDAGVTARFYKAVSDAHLLHIIKVDLASDRFTYDLDESALNRARMMDGKLILVTNMPDHTPIEIIHRYKALADIERGFRVLKSEIEIMPVFHRRPDRIRAHALICFLALVLYRVLRMRLQDRSSPYTPERVLEIVRRIQYHQVTLHQKQSASGLTSITPEQKDLFQTIDLPKPLANRLECQFLIRVIQIINYLRYLLSNSGALFCQTKKLTHDSNSLKSIDWLCSRADGRSTHKHFFSICQTH